MVLILMNRDIYNKQTPFPGTCMTDIDGKIESNTYQKSTLDFGVFY